jgi:hypothetical protein
MGQVERSDAVRDNLSRVRGEDLCVVSIRDHGFFWISIQDSFERFRVSRVVAATEIDETTDEEFVASQHRRTHRLHKRDYRVANYSFAGEDSGIMVGAMVVWTMDAGTLA